MANESSELVKQGKLDEALAALEDQVRKDPADAKLRVFLFQLLCVLGEWERAMTQLNVAAELDSSALVMAQVCRISLNCEALRAEVFAGKRAPLIFGEPEEWVGWMVQANQLAAQGEYRASQELRDRALEAAPAIPGTIDGQPFEWIADADLRCGPILEAMIEGRYYWVPLPNIRTLALQEPEDLRDLVWLPAIFTWTNGGNAVGFIPARYPGSEKAEDFALRLARKTEWIEQEGGLYLGVGQRMLTTDQGEYALLDTRKIELRHPGSEGGEAAPGPSGPEGKERDDA